MSSAPTPLWSVMIPTFNCARYLRTTLASVLAQDPGPAQMEIEVIDDHSTADDPAAVVAEVGRGRVKFFRQPQNVGLVANFNTCVARARGQLVHLLHGDDLVDPGFYARLAQVAATHPDTAWFACRSFIIDQDDQLLSITGRCPALEAPTRDAAPFFYATPAQTPSVVVRRAAYERLGAFTAGFPHVADREMWARAIAGGGGLMIPDVLARYRVHAANDTARRARAGQHLREILACADHLGQQHPTFDRAIARRTVAEIAVQQAGDFSRNGDPEAADACMALWRELTPRAVRLRLGLRNRLLGLFGLNGV